MKKSLTTYLSIIIVFVIGLFWIHIDSLVVLVAFSLIITLPILGLVLVACLVFVIKGKLTKNRKLMRKGLKGGLLLFVFILSPILSIKVVDRYNKVSARGVINELEAYREINGYYPNNLSVIYGVNYPQENFSYDSIRGSYTIKFRNGGLITTKYNSKEKKWIDYGWSD